MDAPRYQPPLRKLIAEPGFWFCALPNLFHFLFISDTHIGVNRGISMILTLWASQIMGIIWIIAAGRQKRLQRLGICVFFALFCLGSTYGHLGLRLRVLVSLPALTQLSARLERGEKVAFPCQAGLFPVLSGGSGQRSTSFSFREISTGGEGELVRGGTRDTDIREAYLPLVGGWQIYMREE